MLEAFVHSVGLGMFDTANVSANIGFNYNKITESITNIASGVNGDMTVLDIKIADKLRVAIDENVLQIRDAQDKMGELEASRAENALKLDVANRIKELAIAYNNDTLADSEKDQIQSQVDELSKLLNDDGRIGAYGSSFHMTDDGKYSLLDIDLTISESSDGSQVSSYVTTDIVISDISNLLSENDNFMIAVENLTSVSSSTTSIPSINDVSIEDEESHEYDLSSDGTMSSIDKMMESLSSRVAGITGQINALNYQIDDLMNKQNNMKGRLNDLTAVDMAKETAEMMKAKVLTAVGTDVLKVQNQLEQSMVLSLLMQ